jgi:gas vesicle protein
MSDNDSDFGAFLVGFMAGGMVGAAIALLFAPQSGEETRTLIRDKSIELKDKAVETADEARVRAERALEEARARADTAYSEARMRADELAKMTKERASELQKRGQVVLEEQKTRLGDAIEAGKKATRRRQESPEDQGGEPPVETPGEAPVV